MNFIFKIFHDKIDDSVHNQFIRFGKGDYGRRALLSLWKTGDKTKIKSSFEFANDFVLFVAGLGEVSFQGDIWSKEPLPGLPVGQKKAGKWVYEVENIGSKKILELAGKTYYFLLRGDGPGIKLGIKSKLPKPGKSEDKIDDKFCQLEIDERYYHAAKADFFWDLPDCKKATVEHRFVITEIILPKTNEKDFAKLREMAKRKGKIIRLANIDGKQVVSEKNFEA